jgi:hypothetical protein
MNQILYIEKNKKKKEPLELKTVVKIFSVIIIIFGVILLAKGGYTIYKNVSEKSNENGIPTVNISQIDNKLQINIKHDSAIEKIIYSWNDGEETTMQGKGQSNITETISIPSGTNTLKMQVIDTKGKKTEITKEYTTDDVDRTNPEIEFVVENSKVKIVAKDETQISYMAYHWNNEDDTTVNAREDSPKQIEEKISILKGENTLTIVAVDEAGNETTKVQVFKGATKPTIETSQENDTLIIKVKDQENIQKIEITLNGQFYSTDSENTNSSLDMQEVEIKQALPSGTNTITITAYNVSGLSEQVTLDITI